MAKVEINKPARSWTTTFLALLLTFVFASPALAVQPTVKTVPWVATNSLIPHDTSSGKSITLKGTSGVAGATIEYTWDFGDGTAPMVGTVTNQYVIDATHAYVGSPNDIFTARLTVTDTSTGESDSQIYLVEIRDKTLETEVNVAIDEGLWYLHKTMQRFSSGGQEFGDWNQGTSCGSRCASSGYYGITPTNLNAFEANGHLESGPTSDPYTEDVARGMRRLFQFLTTEGISNQTNGTGVVDPDSNGNGYGVRVNQSNYVYQGGMFMDAIIASGTPSAVTTTGQAPAGANPGILGRTYADVVQDMVDSYAYGQYDPGAARGGWRYVWNQGPDGSACQWAAIGLLAAERAGWAGVTVPGWVKTENEVWLGCSQNSNGAFGYTSNGSFPWGPYAVAPSGMVQMALTGLAAAMPAGTRPRPISATASATPVVRGAPSAATTTGCSPS